MSTKHKKEADKNDEKVLGEFTITVDDIATHIIGMIDEAQANFNTEIEKINAEIASIRDELHAVVAGALREKSEDSYEYKDEPEAQE